MNSPLILVDGSSYFFRAFHALPPLTNAKGQPTGAVFGVANMIKRLMKDYTPSRMAVVFDAKGKTFRDDLFPDYKAHRPPMPHDLMSQFEPLVALLKAMGLPLLIEQGVEADDVIGTLAKEATEAGQDVLISTGDKDMAQLVNRHVTLINTMSNQLLDEQGVVDKFGVAPSQIVDYLTLIGDTSDNVPGVTKCGPKTAVKWLSEYGTLDNLVLHADAIGGKIGEHLRAHLSMLPLCKQLVTIKDDVALPIRFDALTLAPEHTDTLIELARELEFKHWLKELMSKNERNAPEGSGTDSTPSYTLIHDEATWQHWLQQLKNATRFCIDTETTSLDPMCAEIVGISLSIEENHPAYIPLAHNDALAQLNKTEVLEALKPILEDSSIQKIGQNLKYDCNVLRNANIRLQGMAFDTMLESYLLNSSAGRHDMDSLALKYLGYKTITYEDVAGKGVKQKRFDDIPIAKAAPYAAEDADITLKLHHTLYPLLAPSLQRVLKEIEMPLLPVLADMEYHGVMIDVPRLEKHGTRLKERMHHLQEEALGLAGKAFNLNSPKQLQEILFDELKLPILSKTPTGQPSTAEAVLQELAYDYRLPAVILEYRSLSKLVSTYIDALPKRVNPKTHRVHTSYNQAVAATGRLSSSEPNLQNIPVRTEEGRLIRTAFIAPEHHVLLASDYSQIELRIMAHLSNDANLLKAFSNGWDVHAATAAEIFQTDIDKVTHEQRRRAKAVNFGLIYGMSAFGLSKQIGVERGEAEQYMKTYFERYPGVLDYMEKTRQHAKEKGYVETLFGRRLYLPEIHAQNMMRRKAAERTAINAPMQGSAADLIKLAMIHIAKWQEEQDDARMIMQVHDELVFEVKQSAVEACQHKVRELMEQVVHLNVPVRVSIGVGQNWDEAH